MSNNEYMWWVARSSMKPLPSVREDMHMGNLLYVNSSNQFSGLKISRTEAYNNWFKGTDEEEWGEAKKLVEKLQKELDEKKKNENG